MKNSKKESFKKVNYLIKLIKKEKQRNSKDKKMEAELTNKQEDFLLEEARERAFEKKLNRPAWWLADDEEVFKQTACQFCGKQINQCDARIFVDKETLLEIEVCEDCEADLQKGEQ